MHRTRTNPRRADTDKDGLSDGREIRIRTDPRDRDTDGDGLTDGSEVDGGTVFNRPFFEDSSFEASNPRRADTDRDGLSDRIERRIGTSPVRADTDGDGYSDYQEVRAGTNPLDPNSPAQAPASAAASASSAAAFGHDAPGYRDHRRSVRHHSLDLRRVRLHGFGVVLDLLLSPRRSRVRVVQLTQGVHGPGSRDAHLRRPSHRLGREHRRQRCLAHVDGEHA